MKTEEQRRHYEAPKMEIVEMKMEGYLLAGSGGELDPLSPFNV